MPNKMRLGWYAGVSKWMDLLVEAWGSYLELW